MAAALGSTSDGEWGVSAGVRWFWGVLSALILLVLGALDIAALIAAIGGNAYALLVLVLTAPSAYLVGRACSRIAIVRVSIGAEEIVVVGPLRTVRVPTRHAEEFVAEVRPGLAGGQPTVSLRYDRGRSISLWLFNRYGTSARFDEIVAELEARAEELNRALAQAKQAAGVIVAAVQQAQGEPA